MEYFYIVLFTLLILWSGISIFVIRNLMNKNEIMEDFIEKQDVELKKTDSALSLIDNKVAFSSDDEVGFYFDQIKQLQENLNRFKLR
jgi:hypothetical protein